MNAAMTPNAGTVRSVRLWPARRSDTYIAGAEIAHVTAITVETEKAVGRVQRAHRGAKKGDRRENAGQQGHHFVGPGSSEHCLHVPASTVWLRSAEKPYFS